MAQKTYITKRKKLSSMLFERALPNEYLVVVGSKSIVPILGGKKFKWFKKFIRIPAYVQKLKFRTDNANIDYQGIGIEGYATWRINPENPEIAISTLDFFDDIDPMAKTNEDLKTICIEAVRHVIANMSIKDALKNKDAIADNLTKQLIVIEKKWGIIFDQVGIESVTIMSNTLFANLQSDYRSKLRLQASKTKISTDREIAKEQNSIFEINELEKVQTQQKIDIANIDKTTFISKREIEEKHNISEIERQFEAKQFNTDIEFNKEKEQKNYELEQIEKELQFSLNEIQTNLLNSNIKLVDIENIISRKKLDIFKLERQAKQTYTEKELSKLLIESLPEIFKAINIENYSVLENSNDGKNTFPLTKILNEIIFTLKNSSILEQNKE